MEVIYAENAVQHIFSGKAVSRVIRAHFIVDSVLNSMLISTSLTDESSHSSSQIGETNTEENDESSHSSSQVGETNTEENDESSHSNSQAGETNTEENELLNGVSQVYEDLLSGVISMEDACQTECVVTVKEKIEQLKSTMKNQKTVQLWLVYMEMVAVLKKFLKAERLGDWTLHLEALREMLPFLAASGHNLYTKSVRLYLKKMAELKDTHPDIHSEI